MTLLFIGDWFRALTSVEQVFWGISLTFSVLFVIQFVVSLFGFDFDADVEAELGDGGSGGMDFDFSLLSVRSIVAFFTFFGWTGVLMLKGGSSLLAVLVGSGLSGIFAMLIVAYMLYLFTKFNQSGTIDLEQALFQKGEVYLTIPGGKEGMGKVQVQIGQNKREMRAITEGSSIPNGAPIRVIEVLEDNILIVEAIQPLGKTEI